VLDASSYFEVFRKERVNLTSTLFAGGDWRWRLRSSGGNIVAQGDGYANQEDCRRAVDALRNGAATAQVRIPSEPASASHHHKAEQRSFQHKHLCDTRSRSQ
jgi:uncharacterized protein YegP (UPF0339 family)